MEFREWIEKDTETFFNEDEFGELANVNGRKILVVRDDEKLQEYNSKAVDALARGSILIHVKSSNFEHIPQVDKLMLFNEETYRIVNVTCDMGVLSITLGRYSG